MRIKDNRLQKESIFLAFMNSEHAAVTKIKKYFRDEVNKIIQATEELLGIKDMPITDENRGQVMLSVYELLSLSSESLSEIQSEFENLHQIHEDLLSSYEQLAKINERQTELIDLYAEKDKHEDQAVQDLRAQIVELQKQLEEKTKKSACRPGKQDKSLEEQKEDIQKRLQDIETRKEKLEKKYKQLENIKEQVLAGSEKAADTKPDQIETDDSMGESEEDHHGQEKASVVDELQAKINELTNEVEELKYQAKKDSSTSSVPPSMDGYSGSKSAKAQKNDTDAGEVPGDDEYDEEVAEEFARRDPDKSPNKKSGGLRGKPAGGNGNGRHMPDFDEERIVRCEPSRCSACPQRETCQALQSAVPVNRAYSVYDVEIHRVKTNYQPIQCTCPMEGVGTITGTYPSHVKNWFQFGNGIRALAVTLSTVGMVSYERIADILKELINDDQLSSVSINNWVKSAAEYLRPTARYLKAGVFDGDYLNSDETGVKVKGVLHWLHTACNPEFTYMRVDRKRGADAMERIGVLPGYLGTIITDCWSSYWEYGTAHGLCNAHLLRELFALVKFFVRDKGWAEKMMDLLLHMKRRREELKTKGEKAFTQEELESLQTQYRELVEEGFRAHPEVGKTERKNGRVKNSRGLNLLERLKEREKNFLLFLTDWSVPFSNNLAERSFRLVCIKKKVVGSFDTYEGADDFGLIWSYISTARKRGLNSYDAIKRALAKDSINFLFDEEEKQYLETVAEEMDQKGLERFEQCRQEAMSSIDAAKETLSRKEAGLVEAKTKEAKALDKMEAAAAVLSEAEKTLIGTTVSMPTYKAAVSAVDKAQIKSHKAKDKYQKAQDTRKKKETLLEKAREKFRETIDALNLRIRAMGYFLDLPEEAISVYTDS